MRGSPSEVCKLERKKVFSAKFASRTGEIKKKKFTRSVGWKRRYFSRQPYGDNLKGGTDIEIEGFYFLTYFTVQSHSHKSAWTIFFEGQGKIFFNIEKVLVNIIEEQPYCTAILFFSIVLRKSQIFIDL